MKIKKILYLLTIILVLIFLSFNFSACKKNDIANKLDNYMLAFNKNSNFKYCGTILVAKGDKILFNKAYGMANYEKRIPNKPNSVFAIGSISKSFTAVAIMQLQEQQLLSVNDPISKYIAGNERGDDITIHQLLTHTSGLIRDGLRPSSFRTTLEENINYINKQPLLFEPEASSSYSNAGYTFLAAIIEKVSGKNYNDYIRDNILIPLKMKNSSLGMDALYKARQSIGYKILANETRRLSLIDFSNIIGCGNIFSTTEDLYKYNKALHSEKLLNKDSLDKMFTSYSDFNYGYGWGVSKFLEHKEFSHNGHIGGYNSTIIRFPDDDYVLILLSNNDDDTAINQVCRDLSAIVLGEKYIMPEKIEVVSIDSKTLEKYVGEYEFAEGIKISIKYENGEFYQTEKDGKKFKLLPLSKIEFYPKHDEYSRLKFILDKNNDVTGVEIFTNWKLYVAKKVIKN